MPHLEARAAELDHFGGDVGHVVELGRLDEARLGVDQRNADNAVGGPELARPHPQRFLEQQPRAPVEELEEAAVEHDAGRIAMTPFDGELPVVDEIAHARFRLWYGAGTETRLCLACQSDPRPASTRARPLGN